MEILVGNKDVRLYTTIYPNTGKETVILLHGGPGVPDGLDPVAAHLSQFFQVITFHQRGTLSSPCYSGKYSMERYILDIDAIAAHFDIEKFHLFGHSWGGLYAQIYAEDSPHRLLSMFLCSPASGTGSQWREVGMEVAAYNRKKSTTAEWLGMLKNLSLGLLGSDSAYEKLFTQFCLNCNKGYTVDDPVPVLTSHINARPINRTNLALLLHAMLEVQPNPGFKITVSYGDDDIFGASVRYVRERYPTAQFFSIPESSHFAWLQNKQEFYKVLANHYGLKHTTTLTDT